MGLSALEFWSHLWPDPMPASQEKPQKKAKIEVAETTIEKEFEDHTFCMKVAVLVFFNFKRGVTYRK